MLVPMQKLLISAILIYFVAEVYAIINCQQTQDAAILERNGSSPLLRNLFSTT